MDYKAYLSSLFYLTEAIKYLSPEHKIITMNQVVNLCRQGFTETEVFGFKVYQVLYERFPDLVWFNKNFLNKGKGTIYLHKREILDPQEKPRVFHGRRAENEDNLEVDVEFNLVTGPVLVKMYYCEEQNDQDGYSASWNMRLMFTNYKHYTEADMRLLMDQIRDFFPNRD